MRKSFGGSTFLEVAVTTTGRVQHTSRRDAAAVFTRISSRDSREDCGRGVRTRAVWRVRGSGWYGSGSLGYVNGSAQEGRQISCSRRWVPGGFCGAMHNDGEAEWTRRDTHAKLKSAFERSRVVVGRSPRCALGKDRCHVKHKDKIDFFKLTLTLCGSTRRVSRTIHAQQGNPNEAPYIDINVHNRSGRFVNAIRHSKFAVCGEKR